MADETNASSRSRERFAASVGKYDTLCLGGGGMKCFSYIGGFEVLQEAFCEEGETVGALFDNFSGASGGAMVALMTASGHTTDELEIQASDVELRKRIFKKNALDLILPKNGAAGLNDGNALKEFIKKALLNKGVLKTGEEDLTFAQFKERTKKSLALSVAYIYVDDIILANLKPNFEIVGNRSEDADALVIETCVDSMRIPYYIQPRFDEKRRRYALDGGTFMNVPACAFDVTKTFVMKTCTDSSVERRDLMESMHTSGDRTRHIRDLSNGKINMVDVIKSVLMSYASMMDQKADEGVPRETHEWATIRMAVPASYMDDFYMSSQKIARIIEMGREGARQFLGKLTARALLRDRINDEAAAKNDENHPTMRTLFKTKLA